MAPFAWQSNKAIVFYFTQNRLQDFIQCQGTEARFDFRDTNIQSITPSYDELMSIPMREECVCCSPPQAYKA